MKSEIFMDAQDVADELGISKLTRLFVSSTKNCRH